MSHKATNWLANTRGLPPGEFVILFHLCDCHNPSNGCFPSQLYIKDVTGLSNGSINNHLKSLEIKGYLKREKRHEFGSNKRKSTRYILRFELEEAQEPTPKSGDGPISKKQQKPSPKSGDGPISKKQQKPSPNIGKSHLQNLETKEVIEPVIKTNLSTSQAKPEITIFQIRKDLRKVFDEFGMSKPTQHPELIQFRKMWGFECQRASESALDAFVAFGLMDEHNRDAAMAAMPFYQMAQKRERDPDLSGEFGQMDHQTFVGGDGGA